MVCCIHTGNAAYLAVGRRTYLAMSILSGLMLVVMALLLLLYRTMKPKAVNPASVRTEEGDELEDAVGYSRGDDRVELLKHFQMEEETSIDDTGGDSEEAAELASWHGSTETDSAPLLGEENV